MLKKITLLTTMLLLTSHVSAHPGSHAELSFTAIGQHLASNPYHISLLLVIPALFSIAVVIRKKYRNN